jgi:hypothetical protein
MLLSSHLNIPVIPKFCSMVTGILYKGAAMYCHTNKDTRKPDATFMIVSASDSNFGCCIDAPDFRA